MNLYGFTGEMYKLDIVYFFVVNMIAKRIAHLYFSCIFVCKFIENCVFVIYYLHYSMHILHLHTCLF